MANEFIEQVEGGQNDEGIQELHDSKKDDRAQLPDGVGISFEDISIMLAMKHDTSVSKSDPILMLVSICNVFLGEIQKLHQKHNEAISKIIAGKTKEYINSVKSNTDAFTKTLSDASVEGIRGIFEKHADALQAAKWNMRWCATICAISALGILFSGLISR